MRPRREPLAATVAGCVGSLLVHACIAWLSVLVVREASLRALSRAADPDLRMLDRRPPPELTLGLEDATSRSATWLGALEETGSAGPASDTAQGAFALASGGLELPLPGALAAASGAGDPIPQSPAPLLAQQPAELRETLEHEAARAEAVRRSIEEMAAMEEAARAAMQRAARELLELQQAAEKARREQASVGQPTDAPPDASPGSGDAEPAEGEASDRESEAFSLADALRVTPGQPAAGKGIEIRTVRPRWTHFTELFRPGGEVAVRVLFRRDGRVQEVIPLRLTGHPDVDRPLLDAIYNWRASGARLLELPEGGDPPATLQIVLVVTLR